MRPPDSWRTARATLAIVAVTAAATILVWATGLDVEAAVAGGFIPARVGADITPDLFLLPVALTPLSATLLHANILHLGFNLLILGFCGRATEGVLGPVGIVLLYLAGAYAAAAAQWGLDPDGLVPMIGASGAASAVIGAYAMLFGRNKVKVASPRLALWLNALWLMAAWVLLQAAIGYTFSRAGDLQIAVAAYVGGFIAGLALAYPLLLVRYRNA